MIQTKLISALYPAAPDRAMGKPMAAAVPLAVSRG